MNTIVASAIAPPPVPDIPEPSPDSPEIPRPGVPVPEISNPISPAQAQPGPSLSPNSPSMPHT